MILECQQHPDYQQAVQTLLDIAEQYGGHAKTLGGAGSTTVTDARTSMAQAEADLKVILPLSGYVSTNTLMRCRH